jgi:hypothetical protein
MLRVVLYAANENGEFMKIAFLMLLVSSIGFAQQQYETKTYQCGPVELSFYQLQTKPVNPYYVNAEANLYYQITATVKNDLTISNEIGSIPGGSYLVEKSRCTLNLNCVGRINSMKKNLNTEKPTLLATMTGDPRFNITHLTLELAEHEVKIKELQNKNKL